MKKFILIFLMISVFAFAEMPTNADIEKKYIENPVVIYDMIRALYNVEHAIPELSPVQYAAFILGDDLIVAPIEPYMTIKIAHLKYAISIPEQEYKDIIPRCKFLWWIIPTVAVGGLSIGLLLPYIIGGLK